jgi:putative restriction endonuclease
VALGEAPGHPPGSVFADRRALAEAGVHRALQAGIVGRAEEGAESVVISGGYVDDEDYGDEVVYTGAGGRDPATGRQVAPQHLNRTNLALATSLRHGLPVRVVRRVQGVGYRYDGLFRVDDYWPETGIDGYRVWRFRLVRLPEEGMAEGRIGEQIALYGAAPRRAGTVTRVVRDTAVTREVKRLHDFRCQVCGARLDTPPGPYAEAAHVRPLGRPHDGPDVLANVLCLCPNHHVQFDRWAFALADDLALIGLDGQLRVHPHHRIEAEHVRYHRRLFEAAA